MEEMEMQNILTLMRLPGKLKKCKAYLMKDHSILSKAFSRSILSIMLAFLPLIFEKWVMYS